MKPLQKILTATLWGLMVLIMVSVIGAGLWRRSAHTQLQVLADAPAFEMVDQDNRPITLESLRGKAWIADFVFTHCAGPCPIMTAKMAQLQKKIDSKDVHFVSFSVDPERDTPEVLKEYAAKFKADESRWRFLTGSKDALMATARGMLLTAMPATADSPIIHSEKFVLIDAAGRIRKYYDSLDQDDMKALPRDAEALGEEAGESR